MKLRSAPIDDVFQEAAFVLTQDGGQPARLLLFILGRFYRALHWLLLAALRRPWRSAEDEIGGHS